jgi:hypothetical protein
MLERFAPSIADNLIAAAKAHEPMWSLLKEQRELFAQHSMDDKDKYAVGFLSGLQLASSLVSFGATYVNQSITEGTKDMPEDLRAQALTYGFHQIVNLGALAAAVYDVGDRIYKISKNGSPDAQQRNRIGKVLISSALHTEAMSLAERIVALTTVPEGTSIN